MLPMAVNDLKSSAFVLKPGAMSRPPPMARSHGAAKGASHDAIHCRTHFSSFGSMPDGSRAASGRLPVNEYRLGAALKDSGSGEANRPHAGTYCRARIA